MGAGAGARAQAARRPPRCRGRRARRRARTTCPPAASRWRPTTATRRRARARARSRCASPPATPALEAGRPTYVVRRLPNPKYQITSPCDVCVPLVVSLEFPSLMYCFALSLNFVLKLKVHLNELKSVSIILFLYNIF